MDECWNQGNLNTVMELVANDCRYHDPVFPSLTSGAENIKNHIQTCRSGFPDLTFTTDDTIDLAEKIIAATQPEHFTAGATALVANALGDSRCGHGRLHIFCGDCNGVGDVFRSRG